MITLLKRSLFIFLSVAVFLIGALWLVLSSPLARDFRVSLAGDMLSEVFGQDAIVDGDARLALFPETELVISGLRLPASDFPEENLAVLNEARFALPMAYLIGSGIVMPEIEANGLVINLTRDVDDRTTWRVQPETATNQTTGQQPDLIRFLGERKITFRNMAVNVENLKTGFEFDFELTEFDVAQSATSDGSTADVRFRGLVNGQPVAFDGSFPDGAPFEATAKMGHLTVRFNGEKPDDRPGGDFIASVSAETDDLQNLLDSLRLQGNAKGVGTARALLDRNNGNFDFDEIDIRLDLANGRVATLTGRLNDLRSGPDFDLDFLFDLVGSNQPPPPAVFFKDIRPMAIETRVVGRDGIIEVDRLSIETNAFEEQAQNIGPFRVERVLRAPDGRLQLKGLSLTLGPEDAPIIVAKGNVDDLLKFRDYSLVGDLDLPARTVLLTLLPEEADQFGRLVGHLQLKDVEGKPQLSQLVLSSDNTTLWKAELEMTGNNLLNLEEIDLDASVSAPNGQKVLKALQLDPIDIGLVGLDVEARLSEAELSTVGRITANASQIDHKFALSISDGLARLRGELRSDDLVTDDFQKALDALSEIGRLRTVYAEQNEASGKEKTLVLPDDQDAEVLSEDLSEFQPLVLPDASDEGATTEEDFEGYQPLVIKTAENDMAIEDVLEWDNFVRHIDAEVILDIKKIAGLVGIKTLNSRAELKKGVGKVGPVDISFGQGRATVNAQINIAERSEWMRLYGSTGGWDFGNALEQAGLNIAADGTLDGSFDFTGLHGSAIEFAQSMSGRATIDLRDGQINTALLELAGLGVLPWLFSQERRQGYTEIVCIKAPLKVDRGRIVTQDTVIETRNVQLVASGQVDLKNETLSIQAAPRPVGKPLSRSAWPFEVSGSLKSPDVKIAQRTRRTAREPVSMPDQRVPCVPDVSQLQKN